MDNIEKAPLSSKKFVAYVMTNLLMKILLFAMLAREASDYVMISALITTSFVDVGYILGQAALDKYVRVANVANKKITVVRKNS